jgi:hypothetical protein
MSSPEKEE